MSRAAILAGGRGTRLAPYTTVLPKPLLPMGDRPILELILHQLARSGIERVDLCVGHLGELIRAYFTESGSAPEGLELNYHYEDEPLGTAGAVRNLEPPEGPMLVMNGDILTTLDYRALIDFHTESDSKLTIASHRKEVRIDLGVIESESAQVSGYMEKPVIGYEVSMGIYVYSPEAVASIPEGRFDFPDLVLKMVGEGQRVCKFPFEGPWYDIGTPAEFQSATEAFEDEPDLYDSP
jgi:NDP-sugar pyrophosphorylase family protein